MIDGNTKAVLQVKTTIKNELGEKVNEWTDTQILKGWLDYTGGDAGYKSNFKGEVAETTHIFICDYDAVCAKLKNTSCRSIIENKIYDVLLIDDPMELHSQLEIFLKHNGVIK